MIAMSLLNTLQFESPLYHTFSAGGQVSLDPVKSGGPMDSLDPADPAPEKGDSCCCEGEHGCILKYMLANNGKTPPKCRCGYSRNPQEKRCGCGTKGCPCGGVSEGSLSGDCPCGGEGCPEGEPPCDKKDDGGEFDDGNTGNGGTEEEEPESEDEEEEESLPEGDEDSESLDCNIQQYAWGEWSDCVSDGGSGGIQTREKEVTHNTDDVRCAQEVNEYASSLVDAWRSEGRDIGSVGFWQPDEMFASGNKYWQRIFEHRPCEFVEEDEGEEDGEADNTEEAEVQENEIDDGRNGMVIQTSGYVEPTCPENSVYDEDEKICKCKLGYSANEGSSACERDTLGFLLEAKWWILGGAALLGAYGYSQSR